MHVNLADVACADIAIGLSGKAVRGAGVIRLLSGQRSCGYYIISRGVHTCRGQQQNCSTKPFSTHLSSRAEGLRCCFKPVLEGGTPAPVDSSVPAFLLGLSGTCWTFWNRIIWNDFLEPLFGITCWNNFLGSTADYSESETLERCHWSKYLRMEPPCHCQSGGARVYGLADTLPLLAQFLNSDGRFRPRNTVSRPA